jgi:hypothetical protein
VKFRFEEMREALGLLEEVESGGTGHRGSTGVPVGRLVMYRELARQRAPVLHERWSGAAGFADAVCRSEERPRRTRESC